jgi:ketosteroid isomerase-like protein
MPNKGDVHVTPGDNGWRVEVEGSGQARSTHRTQKAAAKAGRDVAKSNKSELLIHGRDGRIRDRRTYGPDPRRTRG